MKKLLFIMLASTLAFSACEKNEIPALGDPASKLEGINDTWKLVQVLQEDEKIPDSQFASFDISEFFLANGTPTITFNSAALTYSYTDGGAPNYLGSSGTWKFDNDLFPSYITAVDAGTASSSKWELGGPTRPVDTKLKIKIRRGCVADATYFYNFVFERQ